MEKSVETLFTITKEIFKQKVHFWSAVTDTGLNQSFFCSLFFPIYTT